MEYKNNELFTIKLMNLSTKDLIKDTFIKLLDSLALRELLCLIKKD